ncbi:MAG: PIN domain-containing protein [Gammaproteobacteria bacterium]|nr:PIN domain-containing protein [Gammaproteobacteria bacterium]
MAVLVDTSIWIDYFRSGNNSQNLEYLLDENLVVINDVILAELIPYLKLKKQSKVIKLLNEINRIPLNVLWHEIIDFQVQCLRNGANGVGIPDLIIAQSAKQNSVQIYSLDKHFRLLRDVISIELYV